MVFKLYFPSGKTFMTQEFDDKDFADCFYVYGSTIYFTADKTSEIWQCR